MFWRFDPRQRGGSQKLMPAKARLFSIGYLWLIEVAMGSRDALQVTVLRV